MKKRMTDIDKWSDPWFRKLSPVMKNIWQYICDNCDNAGVWKCDFELAEFQIGAKKIDWDNVKDIFEKRIYEFGNCETKWYIKKFIKFQQGTQLKENCKPHQEIIRLLKEHSLIDMVLDKDFNILDTLNIPLAKGYGRDKVIVIDKGKGIVIDKGKGKNSKKGDLENQIKERIKKFSATTQNYVYVYIDFFKTEKQGEYDLTDLPAQSLRKFIGILDDLIELQNGKSKINGQIIPNTKEQFELALIETSAKDLNQIENHNYLKKVLITTIRNWGKNNTGKPYSNKTAKAHVAIENWEPSDDQRRS